jgi:hypothetical protein
MLLSRGRTNLHTLPMLILLLCLYTQASLLQMFEVDLSLQISPAVRVIALRMCEMRWLFQQVIKTNVYNKLSIYSV